MYEDVSMHVARVCCANESCMLCDWAFGLCVSNSVWVSLFNGISAFVDYLIPKPSF